MEIKINLDSPVNTPSYKNAGSISNYYLSQPVEIKGEVTANSTTYVLTFKKAGQTASWEKKLYFTLPELKIKNATYASLEAKKHLEMCIKLFSDFSTVYMSSDEFEAIVQSCLNDFFGTKVKAEELESHTNLCIKCIWENLIDVVGQLDYQEHKGYLFLGYSKSTTNPGKYYLNPIRWEYLTRKLFYSGSGANNNYLESLDPKDFKDYTSEIKETYWQKPLNVQFSFKKDPHVEVDLRGLVDGKILLTDPSAPVVDKTVPEVAAPYAIPDPEDEIPF